MKAGAMVWRGGAISCPGKVDYVMWKEGLVVGRGGTFGARDRILPEAC